MKKYIIYSMTVAFALSAVFTACKKDKDDKGSNDVIPVTGVTLDPETLTLSVDGTATLTATVLPANATNKAVTWASDNPNIATVDNGTVTAKAEGTATITVTTVDGNKSATCTLTVYDDTEEGVVINGVRWATRNLGAGGHFVAKPEDYGGYYQWGRRADGHEQPTSGTTTTLSDTDTPAHGDFIIASEDPLDWRTPQNNNLWGATKTSNDPSPAGWRVPTIEEWNSLHDWNFVKRESGVNGFRFTDKATGASLFLPAAGGRIDDGLFSGVDDFAIYWSSSIHKNDSTKAYCKYDDFQGSGGGSGTSRARGLNIRCVADQ